MPPRQVQRFYTRMGFLLLLGSLAACDDGLVELSLLAAAGGNPDAGFAGFSAQGGRGGAVGVWEPRAGVGGVPRLPQPNPCDEEGTELEEVQERELREAFSDAFASGAYCPNLSTAQRRPLLLDRDLDFRVRLTICFAFESRNWFQVPRTPAMGWVLIDTPNLEDAKRALLGGDRTKLCEEAERTPFRHIGVGHLSDVWIVFLSPGPPEDMQKP